MLSMVVGLLLIAGVVILIRRRAGSKRALSGTEATRPVFQIDPPRRRMSPLKEERL